VPEEVAEEVAGEAATPIEVAEEASQG